MKQSFKILAISQLEALAAVFLLIILTLYISFSVLDNDGYLSRYISNLPTNGSLYAQYIDLSNRINASSLAGNLAVFCFWGAAGLLLYYVLYYLFLTEREASALIHALRSPKADRVSLLEYEFAAVGLRVGAAIAMLFFGLFFQLFILPYELVVLNISEMTPVVDRSIELIAAAVLLLASLHVVIILTRCILARTRVFF